MRHARQCLWHLATISRPEWHDTLRPMAHLYGDSTPFPHDVDYIEFCCRVIDCSVQLLSAQHAIAAALERAATATELRSTQVARVLALSEVSTSAFEPFLGSDA